MTRCSTYLTVNFRHLILRNKKVSHVNFSLNYHIVCTSNARTSHVHHLHHTYPLERKKAHNFWTDYEESEIVQWVRRLITGKGGRPELGFTMAKAPMCERVRRYHFSFITIYHTTYSCNV